jgi:tetratricopeptide (TPR) repeat protein
MSGGFNEGAARGDPGSLVMDRSSLLDQIGSLTQSGRWEAALPLLQRGIAEDPSDWNLEYLAGQCCRFVGDFDGAVEHLGRASMLAPGVASVFLALGIAHQQRSDWDDAIAAFAHAIDIDPDYDLAYNSLALTQKMSGELHKALHNYDAGAKALARQIVKRMRNDRSSRIFKHRETLGHRWEEYAFYGCTYLAAEAAGVTGVAWPTGAAAFEEERTEHHGGLYWVDRPQGDGTMPRLFLPNYFNTFRETLRSTPSYANLIGNRGTVLSLLGQDDEAARHVEEANEFSQ